MSERTIPVEQFMSGVNSNPPIRVPGTSVFKTAWPRGTPPALAHNLRFNKILHKHVILLTVRQRKLRSPRLQTDWQSKSSATAFHRADPIRIHGGPERPGDADESPRDGYRTGSGRSTYFLA
jgi:K+ transporter